MYHKGLMGRVRYKFMHELCIFSIPYLWIRKRRFSRTELRCKIIGGLLISTKETGAFD